jgi:hypothetical protein
MADYLNAFSADKGEQVNSPIRVRNVNDEDDINNRDIGDSFIYENEDIKAQNTLGPTGLTIYPNMLADNEEVAAPVAIPEQNSQQKNFKQWLIEKAKNAVKQVENEKIEEIISEGEDQASDRSQTEPNVEKRKNRRQSAMSDPIQSFLMQIPPDFLKAEAHSVSAKVY